MFDPIPHGEISYSSDSDGVQATFTCHVGSELVGNPTLVCADNGEWLGSVPSCKGMYADLVTLQ